MKLFISFVSLIFVGLFIAYLNKYDSPKNNDNRPVVKVFGYSSFTSKWGPGPELKTLFEKQCQCKIEFLEGSDSGILLQRLKIEGENLGIDLVIGLDQFDLSKAKKTIQWREFSENQVELVEAISVNPQFNEFIPYDWGVLTFVARKGDTPVTLNSLDDLLKPELNKKIALQDPRTSSPGLQFLYWVIKNKGEQSGFEYIAQMMKQAHSFSPSWSTSYGLFTKKQADMVFSYNTSPLYHLIEEKNDSYIALTSNFEHPLQVEFLGIPQFCQNCELAQDFINLILSPEGQKIIMSKNYMNPVVKGITTGTQFEGIKEFKTIPFEILDDKVIDSWLKKWSELRRDTN